MKEDIQTTIPTTATHILKAQYVQYEIKNVVLNELNVWIWSNFCGIKCIYRTFDK